MNRRLRFSRARLPVAVAMQVLAAALPPGGARRPRVFASRQLLAALLRDDGAAR